MDIQAFWKDVLRQDRNSLPSYFCHEAVIRWHCTNERFTADEFIRANCDYPGEWDGTIERIESYEDRIVTAVNVFPADRTASFHVVSFFSLKDGKILSLDEYWADDGDAPEWRKKLGIGKPIR